MNFLAHLVLSGDEEDVLLGNFIADSVRSSQWRDLKPGVLKGVKLHHHIDEYTDNHPVVELSKARMRPRHGKYSPVIVDIVYDHFLAANFEEFTGDDLEVFSERCYRLFRRRWEELPNPVQRMLPFMEKGNWLFNYRHREGLHSALYGMSKRASFKNLMNEATEDMFVDYRLFEMEFRDFFPALRKYADRVRQSL